MEYLDVEVKKIEMFTRAWSSYERRWSKPQEVPLRCCRTNKNGKNNDGGEQDEGEEDEEKGGKPSPRKRTNMDFSTAFEHFARCPGIINS